MKILVIDDNKDLRYSVTQGLKTIGCSYEFLEASSGKKGLELLENEKVALVLLDIMMPDMDGWEVAAEIKKNQKTKEIPILFLTARTDNLSKGMGKMTAEDYIEKPFEIKDLKVRIEKVLQK